MIEEFYSNFQGIFENPYVVLACFFLLFFILIFQILLKFTAFRNERGVTTLISLIFSFLAIYYINNVYYWILTLNIFLILVAIVIVSFILRAFIKFSKHQFG